MNLNVAHFTKKKTSSNQTELFSGEYYRDAGIDKAVKNADGSIINWSVQAYSFLLSFIEYHKTFMAEDVRSSAAGIVPQPPSKRAWGGIIKRAARAGLIENIGYRPVTNIKAHCTPATLWKVVNF